MLVLQRAYAGASGYVAHPEGMSRLMLMLMMLIVTMPMLMLHPFMGVFVVVPLGTGCSHSPSPIRHPAIKSFIDKRLTQHEYRQHGTGEGCEKRNTLPFAPSRDGARRGRTRPRLTPVAQEAQTMPAAARTPSGWKAGARWRSR